MEWIIKYTKTFKRSLKKLNKGIARRVVKKINVLYSNPFKGKPLRNLYLYIGDNRFRVYSLRVGDYRVAYIVNHLEKTIYLLYVDHRDNIYEKLRHLTES